MTAAAGTLVAPPPSRRERLLGLARALGLFRLCRRLTRRKLRILCYHGIWLGGAPHYGDCLFMSAERFVQRAELLARLGYPVLPLDEAVTRLAAGTLPDCALVITIDDGWYGTYARMLPALKRHGLPATVYVTSYYLLARRPVLNVLVGYMVASSPRLPVAGALRDAVPGLAPFEVEEASMRARLPEALSAHLDALPSLDARWETLERIAAVFGFDLAAVLADRRFDLMNADELLQARRDGFDIQLHTHSHRMHGFDRSRLCEEVRRNRDALSGALGETADSLRHFCYPSGVWDARVFDTLRSLGIRSATTTDFGLNGQDAEPLALRRILDCESMSELELEAKLCGFWSILGGVREALRGLAGRR